MTAQAISDATPDRRAVGLWLLAVAALVFAMVLLGGTTRLTHSGLSIVEWQPVSGVIPPLDQAAWQAEFSHYQQFPEYRDVNAGMTLDQFKAIFWVEYAHRLLGRVIGLVFALPFVYFLWVGALERSLAPRLGLILLLGGAQGFLGWFMVESGLVRDPAVSHYRLTAHLGLAVILYGAILWTAFDLLRPARRRDGGAITRRFAAMLVGLVFLQILAGGLVAGLHAGLIYNTWPLMDGSLAPLGLFTAKPWWRNPLENIAMVQFDHRMLAYLVLACTLALCWRVVAGPGPAAGARRAAALLLLAVLGQVALGIATLLLVVPVPLAVVHQAGALVVFTAALWLCHGLRQSRRVAT
ncbi:MAG TPA: COX15/CtaA family protein [Candidatus Sulfotelmatobacter sp.]|nr:COX15/CtaA family protein [Candidatus Sulfotelmatobacter sp.]